MRVVALLPLLCLALARGAAAGALSEDEEAALLNELLAEGRGDRDGQGVRDQWSAGVGVGSKDDTRAPISKKVRAMMKDNGLECDGCSQDEAVKVVNAFIKDEQKRLAAEARRESILNALAPFALVAAAALLLAASVYVGLAFGDWGAADERAVGDELKAEIKRTQHTYAEAMAAARGAPAAPAPPTWREREEREAWTPRQEKQFQKALGPLVGLPPKERWPLVADKVEGKTKGECASHHKLLGLLEKEAADEGEGLRRRIPRDE